MGVSFEWGHVCRWNRLWEVDYTGTSADRDSKLASRSVLNNFTGDARIPDWDSPNAESVLAAAGTISLLVELIGLAA